MGKADSTRLSFGITKDNFVEVINSLRAQIDRDIRYSEVLGDLLRVEGVPLYDSSALIHALSIALESSFSKLDGAKCMEEINRFCYDLNFGTVEGSDIKTPEDLWYKLTRAKEVFTSNCTGVCGICTDCSSDKEEGEEFSEEDAKELEDALDRFFEHISKGRLEPMDEGEEEDEESLLSPIPKEAFKFMEEINNSMLSLQEYVTIEDLEVKGEGEDKVINFYISEKEKDGNY